MSDQEDEDLKTLKSAIWYSVCSIAKKECSELKVQVTPYYLTSLTELVYNQMVRSGSDLEAFSRHAKRKLINVEDVKMLCRRNDGLRNAMLEFIERNEKNENNK